MIGKDKIALIIAEKGRSLIANLIPDMTRIFEKIGISNLNLSNQEYPNTCLPKEELIKILTLRNNLLTQLNNSVEIINLMKKSIDPLNNLISTTTTTLDVIDKTRIALNFSINLIVSPPGTPGALISTLNNLKDLKDFLYPKLLDYKNSTNLILNSLDFVNNILINFINLFKIIDNYLKNCGISNSNDYINYNSYLNEIEQLNNQQSNNSYNLLYKGFILEILEEEFSPTIKRKIGVAKNSQDIILLKTPPSFTTIPQVLIEELKLIIDKDNLKAD